MALDPDVCYPALRARDPRFDGVFFVAVESTRIYCRPVCPARLPARERCAFFESAAQAERAGYRACFRCRPELAPGHASVDAPSRLARLAAVRIAAGALNGRSVEALARGLGVTPRHLARVMESALGVSPVELAQTTRMALAKQLVQDTRLPLVEVALAAGFSSVRRFNALFQARLGRPPSTIRRDQGAAADEGGGVVLRLDYRPPYAWDAVLDYLRGRAIPGVEAVVDGEYRRSVVLGDLTGSLAVAPWPGRRALRARVSASLAPRLMEVSSRLRAQFDLDARPDVIEAHLARDPAMRALVGARPGLRVPGAFDGFELAVRAVLGQQVSVASATTMSGRLVERFGSPLDAGLAGVHRAFPLARTLAKAALEDVRAVGLPAARAQTVIDLARAVADGRVDLSPGETPPPVVEALRSIRGIGPWTAGYVAMRALRDPDAFLGGDLGVRRALGVTTTREAEDRAQGLRPFRAYAVLHLWHAPVPGGDRP